MPKKVDKWILIIGVLFVVGGGLLVLSLFPDLYKPKKAAEAVRFTPEAARVVEADKQGLRDETLSEDEIIISLVRLSYASSEDAKEFVSKYLEHPSARVRAAAIEAAGAFNELNSFKIITEALNAKESEVRVAALKALGRNQGPEQREAIQEFLARPGLKSEEKAWAYVSLFRSSTEDGDRKNATVKLIKVLGATPSAEVNAAALSALPMLPALPEVVEQARSWLISGESDELAAKSLQYLASQSGESLGSEFQQIPMRSSALFKTVLKEHISSHCPSRLSELSDQSETVGFTCP